MGLLDLFKVSKLKLNTPGGGKPTPYQDSIAQMRNVRFPPNISPGANLDGYVRIEQPGTVPGGIGPSPAPAPAETNYLVTENNNFLMTENDNNLIV